MSNKHISLKENLISLYHNFFISKKYWGICLIIILFSFFAMMEIENYNNPKIEISVLILSCIICTFLISFYQGHKDDKNFYKTVFLVIFIFGIIFSFLTPIMSTHDEVEHFVRAEITSNGIINPNFVEVPTNFSGIFSKGYYLTIQSTFDLAERGKDTISYTHMDLVNSSIFKTDADTLPINYTPVKFHSAFAQNPFFGYLASGIGMALAKLLNLNAIWLLWLGRIFNALLYASIVSIAIKKTPILKIPLFVVACIPAALSQAASVSIDPLINGLGILSIAYFLMLYKSPNKSLDYKPIIKFSVIVLLLGLCKVTYFSFIFLLLFIPIDNLKKKEYFYYSFIIILLFIVLVLLWSKFWVNPLINNSWRLNFNYNHHVDAFNQIRYILNHKKETIINLFHLFNNLNDDLKMQSLFYNSKFNSLFLIFTGAVYLMYPHEKFKLNAKIGALFVFCMLYFGTYFTFLIAWNSVGDLIPQGVQPRYFFPILALIPIFLGFNHMEGDTSHIDNYIFMLTLVFIVFRILLVTTFVY